MVTTTQQRERFEKMHPIEKDYVLFDGNKYVAATQYTTSEAKAEIQQAKWEGYQSGAEDRQAEIDELKRKLEQSKTLLNKWAVFTGISSVKLKDLLKDTERFFGHHQTGEIKDNQCVVELPDDECKRCVGTGSIGGEALGYCMPTDIIKCPNCNGTGKAAIIASGATVKEKL